MLWTRGPGFGRGAGTPGVRSLEEGARSSPASHPASRIPPSLSPFPSLSTTAFRACATTLTLTLRLALAPSTRPLLPPVHLLSRSLFLSSENARSNSILYSEKPMSGYSDRYGSDRGYDRYSRADRRDSYGGGGGYSGGGRRGGGGRGGGLGSSLRTPDWSRMQLQVFQKNFYREDPEVTAFTDRDVEDIRKEYDISVMGTPIPKPIRTFEQSSFPGITS